MSMQAHVYECKLYKYTCINAHVYILCTCIYIWYIYIWSYLCRRPHATEAAQGVHREVLPTFGFCFECCYSPACEGLCSNVSVSLDLQSCASVLEARLEAVFKIRQLSKEWRSSLKGFEWLTPVDMARLGWPEYLGFIYFAAAYRDAMSALLCHLADMSAV